MVSGKFNLNGRVDKITINFDYSPEELDPKEPIRVNAVAAVEVPGASERVQVKFSVKEETLKALAQDLVSFPK